MEDQVQPEVQPQVQPQPEADVQAQPQESAIAPEQSTDQVQQEAPVTQEVTQEVQEAPVQQAQPQADQQVEQTDDYEGVDFSPSDFQAPEQLPNFDLNALPRDPNNPDYVDPNAFAQAIGGTINNAVAQARQQARQEVQEQIREQKLWEQAEKKYPDLATNKDMRDLVKNARMGEMATTLGKRNPSPLQIADKLFSQVNQAKAQGVNQAQNNERIQQSVALESASNTQAPDAKSQLFSQMQSASDPRAQSEARRALLSNLIDSGDIRIVE